VVERFKKCIDGSGLVEDDPGDMERNEEVRKTGRRYNANVSKL
jgi:hypothetical protein